MPDISEIKRIVVPIAHFYGVKRLYLFGSYAKGTASEKSDVDLLVEKGKPMSLLKLSGMRQMVQEALNLSVDLVTTAGIEDNFRKEIAGTEILLYEE
ncbi:MAG: nucleotidyltransferase [Lachnospiraceae bacterium]|nr:nucleotidyltransferase [Lachnospiraceae bacterium]